MPLTTRLMTLTASALALGVTGMTADAQDRRSRAPMNMDGFLAESLLDSEVMGVDGDEIGEVETIIVDADGMIDRIIVETGGFLDIGDKIISVQWEDVDLTPAREGIMVPIDDDNVEDFSLFGDRDRARLSAGAFRVSELIGDEVRLTSRRNEYGSEFGYVSDLRFSMDGELQSVIYQPDVYYDDFDGYYEADFYGYDYDGPFAFDPGYGYYGVDYGINDVDDYVFDYDAYDGDIL
ncbi:PRC-barrel domain-containing protein [Parvularcula oceani]|uniref:PRC-barrel domain-containing protein n=1 Tax=Parvularcula oceani TaxID=1247963 RepID=UPI00068DC6A9|nr:PRC-barrel domain-containing protein [Parvularcula oceani]